MTKSLETPQERGACEGTIEEHARKLKIDPSVLYALMQAEGWASGKRVSETVFKKAMETFFKTPIGGR